MEEDLEKIQYMINNWDKDVVEIDIRPIEHLISAYKKLEEENKELIIENRRQNDIIYNLNQKERMYLNNIKTNYISKQKIKDILCIEDDDTDKILSLLETIVAEFNRLEDIEDRKVQVEYNIIFNKGVESVEKKIRDKLEHFQSELKKIENGEEFENEKDFYTYGIAVLENILEERNK